MVTQLDYFFIVDNLKKTLKLNSKINMKRIV